MDAQQAIVQVIMASIASWLSHKYGWGKRFSDWFNGLKLDWVSGIGLAVIICIGPATLIILYEKLVHWLR